MDDATVCHFGRYTSCCQFEFLLFVIFYVNFITFHYHSFNPSLAHTPTLAHTLVINHKKMEWQVVCLAIFALLCLLGLLSGTVYYIHVTFFSDKTQLDEGNREAKKYMPLALASLTIIIVIVILCVFRRRLFPGCCVRLRDPDFPLLADSWS